MEEKNSLRDECLARLLSLTDVLIALIMSSWILKSWSRCESLMGALSPSVPQSNDIQRHCFLRILFIPLFPKLTLVDHFFMPGFSSVVGSLPSGHVVMKRVTAWGAWKENLLFHALHPFTLQTAYPPITFLSFRLFFLFLLPSNLPWGHMIQWAPSVTPSLHRLSPPLTSLPLPRFSRPLPR